MRATACGLLAVLLCAAMPVAAAADETADPLALFIPDISSAEVPLPGSATPGRYSSSRVGTADQVPAVASVDPVS